MNIQIYFADINDIDYLAKHEHLSKKKVEEKINRKEYIVSRDNNEYFGFLRFSLFWSEIPYIDLIKVEDKHQKKGIGKSMVKLLEKYAIEHDQKLIMSSSQQDESKPQEWHKKIGFKEMGIVNDFSPIQKVPEIIFIKKVER